MTPRERAKVVQLRILRAAAHPLVPHDAKSALSEVVLLIGEWADLLEKIERKLDGNGNQDG